MNECVEENDALAHHRYPYNVPTLDIHSKTQRCSVSLLIANLWPQLTPLSYGSDALFHFGRATPSVKALPFQMV